MRKTFLLLTAVSSLCVANKVIAQDFSVDNKDDVRIYYNITSLMPQLTVEVTKNYYYKGKINIPSTVTYGNNTYWVTSIGDWAFRACSDLTSVSIPNTVTSIGDGAFDNCHGLTSVTIPNSVTSIGSEAFDDCRGLTSISIPNSVTFIGEWAFSGCHGLTSISIPNSITTIRDRTFDDCSALTSVTIPNSVTSIGNEAFSGCNGLTSITIHAAIPPRTRKNTFEKVSKDISIYVPCGALANYKESKYWGNTFKNIIENCAK